jgi:hypothetical protein
MKCVVFVIPSYNVHAHRLQCVAVLLEGTENRFLRNVCTKLHGVTHPKATAFVFTNVKISNSWLRRIILKIILQKKNEFGLNMSAAFVNPVTKLQVL